MCSRNLEGAVGGCEKMIFLFSRFDMYERSVTGGWGSSM